MSQAKTISINGRFYDALTGMPIESSAVAESVEAVSSAASKSRPINQSAKNMHADTQRSKTLNRRHTKRPEAMSKSSVSQNQAAPAVARVRPRQVVAKSPAITKFAPRPQVAPIAAAPAKTPTEIPKPLQKTTAVASASQARQMDIAPVRHPAAVKAQQLQAKKAAQPTKLKRPTVAAPINQSIKVPAQPVHTPSQVIKNNAIDKALKDAPTKKEQKPFKKKSFFARHPRLLSIGSASLALVMLGGYFTYLNMPNLSVRVAATQAGINATYPDYQPDGYRLAGAIAAEEGKVQMKFASNSGPQKYVITQEKSAWDSSAVVDNLVKPASNDSYVTTNERGLTIYTFDGNAAWVNGGILYTVGGDAPLSSEQIRRIATSL